MWTFYSCHSTKIHETIKKRTLTINGCKPTCLRHELVQPVVELGIPQYLSPWVVIPLTSNCALSSTLIKFLSPPPMPFVLENAQAFLMKWIYLISPHPKITRVSYVTRLIPKNLLKNLILTTNYHPPKRIGSEKFPSFLFFKEFPYAPTISKVLRL